MDQSTVLRFLQFQRHVRSDVVQKYQLVFSVSASGSLTRPLRELLKLYLRMAEDWSLTTKKVASVDDKRKSEALQEVPTPVHGPAPALPP
jgi:hypothetical protein